jgi:cell division transport system permease protein
VGSALRRTLRIAGERPRAALWTLLALTSALFAVGIAAVAADNVDRWAQRPATGASMVVYLGEGVEAARAAELVAELRALAGVERAELIPPSESARRLQQALGADTALLEDVDLGSLPSSVEVTLAPGVRDVVAMSPTVRALRGAPGVDDVVVEDGGDDRVATALHTVRVVAWSGAALFAGLALIILLAAIRVRLDRSRHELAVAEMLGAAPGFLVIPTALAGALQGAAAALFAAGAVLAVLRVYGDEVIASLASSLGPVELIIPAGVELALFVAAGAAIGLVGGALAGASRVAR